MPEIKLQHVVSCSSEDKNYPAENLVNGDGFKKWKSAKSGEKQISVTFQLEKATKIEKIDIGNDGSAFIEVLVGKSSAGEDFQVMMVASAFMNPLDSRAGKNMTSVRMFTADKLSKNIVEQKWDRIKVVCTQPFNKTIQYGLAFIRFHSPPEEGSTSTPNPIKTQTTLGGFKLKSDDGDGIKTGSLFSSRDKERVSPAPLTGAAAVRAASKLAEEVQRSSPTTVKPSTPASKPSTPSSKPSTPSSKPSTPSSNPSTPATPRDTSQVKRKHDEETGGSSKRQSIESHQHSDSQKTPLRKQSTSASTASSSSSKAGRDHQSSLKKTKSEPAKLKKSVAFDELMKKVVFVMSGYQNPERGNIRDKALEMGAQYKGDWGRGCTHLICAFENTPKYSQVKGKGRIVGRKWITDSYKAKTLLPWRNYRVGRARTPDDSHSDSDTDDDTPHTTPQKQHTPKPQSSEVKQTARKPEERDPYGGDTDPESGSGDDTEDEIRRVQEAERKQTPKKRSPQKTSVPAGDIYDASTDDEMDTGDNGAVNGVENGEELPPLPDMFQNKKFFFYGTFDHSERRKMLRFVVAYNGSVEDYMSNSVTYVLTRSDWDDNFDQALSDNPSLAFIKPDWLYACDKQQKYIPFQRFSVIPK